MKVSICKNRFEVILDKDEEKFSRKRIFLEVMLQISRWLEWRSGE